VFADKMAACERALAPHTDWSLTEVLRSGDFDRVDVVQPVLFAVMVSLAELWRSVGIAPDAVVGHSQGEIAAAVVAGGLSLEDGAKVVCLRSALLRALAGQGGMMSIGLPADEVRTLLERWPGRLSVAVLNGPSSVVVSGDPGALVELAALGARTRMIPVDYASHSAQVEQIRDELVTALASIRPKTSSVPVFSTVSGEWIDAASMDAGYWYRNLREPVRFDQVVRQLADQGYDSFVEVSPHPVLTVWVQEALEAAKGGVVVGSLRRDHGGLDRFLTSAGELYAHGVPVDWAALYPGGRQIELPTYAFQRQRYWLELPSFAAGSPELEERFWDAVKREDLESLHSWRRNRLGESAVDDWRYRVTWKPLADGPERPLSGTWLVAVPAVEQGTEPDPAVAGTLRELAGHGATVIALELLASDRESLTGRIRAALGDVTPAGVLSLAGLDERPGSAGSEVPAGLLRTVTLLGALGDAGVDAPMWVTTRGAVSVGATDPVRSLPQSMLWGLGGVAAVEYPRRWGGLIDLPEVIDDRVGTWLADILTGLDGEDQVAVRRSGVYGRRLARARTGGRMPARNWQPSGTVLVTGGTGALGGHVARWLAAYGTAHLLLVGRRGPDAPGAAELTAELRELGAEVTVAACDVADRDALAELLGTIPAERPLTAVLHTAGVLDDSVLDSVTEARAAGVARPKLDAALNLHELTKDLDLSAFVLFSSMAGTLGSTGQATYAAANAYLDTLAEWRRSNGLAATSVAWGLWGGDGLASDAVAERLTRDGMPAMPPESAISALRHALDHDDTRLIVSDIDWDRLVPVYTALRPSVILRDLPEAAAHTDRVPDGSDGLVQRLAGMTDAERDTTLGELVRVAAAAVLGYDDDSAIELHRVFKDIGFDSLTAVDLRNRLSEATGLALSVTLVFDYPTPAALAGHLRTELMGVLDEAVAEIPARTAGAAPGTADDPIVIVSMSCRFPGDVNTPEDLWQLLLQDGDAITTFPVNRGWDLEALYDPDPEHAGTTHVREGGFLHDADQFDAGFFGISPREALAIDPQQRLLLETSWEALERAGIDPLSLKGAHGGVFVGASYNDYGTRVNPIPPELEGYMGTGSSSSVASGRISYTLGLDGPALTVDTACSSSLVALHLAAHALRSGECSFALVAGVVVMSTTTSFVEFSRQGGLATDGRVKPFATAADGTAWSEGVGVLMVERLSDAQAGGHPVLAVLRGSAVNQDGASNGLTAPNGPSQQRVIRAALADAGLTTADVDVMEGHGTGTRLGDPIEAQALLATYGQGRPADQPILLGSVKSNLGHTQAASGMAGVMKMVMAIRNGVLPATINVDEPSKLIDWSSGAVSLVTRMTDWPDRGHARRAGVASFGVSGTNAHVIIEAAPALEPAPVERTPAAAVPLLLSARSTDALRTQAARLRTHLSEHPETGLGDIGYSLATTRSLWQHRAVIVSGDREAAMDALGALADTGAAAVQGTAGPVGRTALLFAGQGSQRLGMGLQLRSEFPVFAEAFDEICAAFDPLLDRPLHAVLSESSESAADAAGAALHRTGYTQPALFAVEVALFRLLEHWGVRPDYLLGHSVGELAAAHVAGVLSLADAAVLVAARARLMESMPEGGAMVSLRASEDEVLPLLAGRENEVAMAALNGPESTVISGDHDAVAEIAAHFEELGRKTKWLRVSHAFHSPHMDGMLAEYRDVAHGLTFRQPRIPVVSTVTGRIASPAELCSPDYWVQQVRRPVRFMDGVRTLAEAGVAAFLELGPDGALTAMAADSLTGDPDDVVLVPVLRRDRPEAEAALSALGALHVRGAALDWPAVLAGRGSRRVDLPTYAFEHERYWLDATVASGDVRSAGLDSADHPLLGAAVELADSDGYLFTSRLSVRSHPWLADHGVFGGALLPATAFLELAIRAGDGVGCDRVDELILEVPLVLPERGGVMLQLAVGAGEPAGTRTFSVYARGEDAHADDPWTRHCSGVLSASGVPQPEGLADWPPAGAEEIELAGLYERFAETGFAYGPAFQGLSAVWRRGEEVFAEASLPLDHRSEAGRFGLHPALLDSALHALAFGVLEGTGQGWLPFSWGGVTLHASGAASVRMRMAPSGPETVSITLADGTGQPVASIGSLVMRPASAGQVKPAAAGSHETLFHVDWTELPVSASSAVPSETAGVVVERCVSEGEPADLAAAVRTTTLRVLGLIRDWLEQERNGARLVFLTRGAVPRTATDDVPDLANAAVWGLVRSAQTEHPGQFVLVDQDDAPASQDVLTAALASGEPQLLLRDGSVYAARLARLPMTGTDRTPQWESGGTVLVSGGTGAIGSQVARHLVTGHGVKRLLLTSRSGPAAAGAAELREELTALGAEVAVAACDVADRAALTALLATVPAEYPVSAVVHTAGVVRDGVVGAITPDQLDEALRPKVDAVLNLQELTADHDLSAFVVFSSIAGVFGGMGQANYAAANTFLDALTHWRRHRGLAATSLAWGLWANDTGMSGNLDEADFKRIARGGIIAFSPAEGLALFDSGVAVGEPVVLPVRLDVAALRAQGAVPALLRGLVRAPARRAAGAGKSTADPAAELRQRLGGLSRARRERTLLDLVRTHASTVLGFAGPGAIDVDRGLLDVGFDSLTAVELRNRLRAATGLQLSATLLFDYPTTTAIARHLTEEITPDETQPQTPGQAELAGLESVVGATAGDDAARTLLAGRLEELLTRLRPEGGLEQAGEEVSKRLGDATDDELFTFMDDELGLS
jgi:acyl transferase domain-containing protein/acyl carrier protein